MGVRHATRWYSSNRWASHGTGRSLVLSAVRQSIRAVSQRELHGMELAEYELGAPYGFTGPGRPIGGKP